MTDEELELRVARLVRNERKITLEILSLIQEADTRKHFLARGFSSTFDWLVRGHGYSQAAANRRIQSARFLKSTPEAAAEIISGKLNLSNLAQLNSALRRRELNLGQSVSVDEKLSLMNDLKGKSFEDAEKIIAKVFPEARKREVFQSINGENTRLALNLDNDTVAALKRTKELLSHSLPNSTWAEIISYLAKEYLKRKDPLRKKSESANHRVKSLAAGKCQFRDEKTGHVCGSAYQLEIDHIIPRTQGGSDEPENLRALCRQHNLYEAQRILGTETMAPYRKPIQ